MKNRSLKGSQVRHSELSDNSKLIVQRKRQVIEAVVRMLKSGDSNFSIRKLSKNLDVTERHLYRLFDGLEGLGKSVNEELNKILGTDVLLENLNRDNISDTAVNVFKRFNKNTKILTAYLGSSLGQKFRETWFEDKDRVLKESLLLKGADLKLISPLRLIFSASFWRIMKVECQCSDDEILEAVGLLASNLQGKLLLRRD